MLRKRIYKSKIITAATDDDPDAQILIGEQGLK
jgi:hypothetical protein